MSRYTEMSVCVYRKWTAYVPALLYTVHASICAHAYVPMFVVLFSDRTAVSQSSSDIPLE